MPVRLPTLEQIEDLGSDFGLVLNADEIAAFQQAFKGSLASYGRLDELVPPTLAPVAPRSPGYRPAGSENPYGAWYWKTDIHSGANGLLSGKKVAIKDNICVAGVPMMNGSATLEGYVPDFDATIVTRMLDAGADLRTIQVLLGHADIRTTAKYLRVSMKRLHAAPSPFDALPLQPVEYSADGRRR